MAEKAIKHMMKEYGFGKKEAEQYVNDLFKQIDSLPKEGEPFSEDEKVAIVIGGSRAVVNELGLGGVVEAMKESRESKWYSSRRLLKKLLNY